jgi:hypothetical protein
MLIDKNKAERDQTVGATLRNAGNGQMHNVI